MSIMIDQAGPVVERPIDAATLEFNSSRIVRISDFSRQWCSDMCYALSIDPRSISRKAWEHAAICQVYYERVNYPCLALGFGVGKEPIAAYLSSLSSLVIATDQSRDSALADWVSTGQHADGFKSLTRLPLLYSSPDESEREFRSKVRFRVVDMNSIPYDLLRGRFGFTWSAGSFEHIGGVEAGLRFFCNQMRCLSPGGISAHTTEYNYISDSATVNAHNICLFRRSDLERLSSMLAHQGDTLLPLDLSRDSQLLHSSPDSPLNCRVNEHVTTSVILIAIRGGV